MSIRRRPLSIVFWSAIFFVLAQSQSLSAEGWRPTQEQQTSVTTKTDQFWAILDDGKIEEAYGQFSNSFKSSASLAEFRKIIFDLRENAGKVLERRTTKVTWYRQPIGAEVQTLAAADFTGRTESADVFCGYVVWHLLDEGLMQAIRIEQNFIPNAVSAKFSEAQLTQLKAAWRCAD